MASGYIRNLYDREDTLFKLVVDFNCRPSSYLHSSYFEGVLTDNVFKSIYQTQRGQSKLNSLLLKKFNLKHIFYTDFQLPYLRLALLDPATLSQLSFYAGVIYYNSNITKIVEKKTLLSIKEQLGENVYFFAIKKASLFSRIKPQLTSLNPNPSNLYAAVLTAGQRLLEYLFTECPFSLTQRLQLKFPSSYTWNFNRTVSDDEKRNIFAFLSRLLIKEINPNWQTCFT